MDFLKNIGPTELIVIAVIVLLFFGSRIAVAMGRASGDTLREIKKVKNEIAGETEKNDQPKKTRRK